MKIELTRDWSEFLSVLIARQVRFVLVGGHAVAGHGEPRLTEDLDVFVEPSKPNAKRLRLALVDFGFGAVAPSAVDLARPDKIFMLGQKPYRIDILTGIDGVSFEEAWASRVEAEFESKPLFVIGRDALIANKRAAGRTKDLFDIAMLENHVPSPRKRPKEGAKRPASTKRASTKKRRAPKKRSRR